MEASRQAGPGNATDRLATADGEPPTPLDVVRQHSLTELVRDEIERHIAAGALRPGDKLNEADWATRLRVSRGPVREAFRALEQAGLVRNEKHRGVFVRIVSADEAGELHEVRIALEEAACRRLAARIDSAQLARLRDRVEALRVALAAADHEVCVLLESDLRAALVEAAGNGTLDEARRRVMLELRLVREDDTPKNATTLARAYARHRALLSALASRDADAAAALVREQADEH